MTRVYLGLGANIGNREANIRLALRWLADEGCAVIAVSSMYRNPAMVPDGAEPGPDFFNAAAVVETDLAPHELLRKIKEIEYRIGRRPAERWAARPIDIDILLYGDDVIDTPELTVPHPGIAERPFVLKPLVEIAADAVHPKLGVTIGALASRIDT